MDNIYKELLDYIEEKSKNTHKTKVDFVHCYSKQLFNTAIYLKSGNIELLKNKKLVKKINAPDFIGVKDLLNNQPAKYDVLIKEGSQTVCLSKNEIINNYRLVRKTT